MAAVPLKICEPVDATQAAPISAIDASWVGFEAPFIMSQILMATAFPVPADGIPVRGGAGLMGVPFGELIGLLIRCGGAKAIPTAKIF